MNNVQEYTIYEMIFHTKQCYADEIHKHQLEIHLINKWKAIRNEMTVSKQLTVNFDIIFYIASYKL